MKHKHFIGAIMAMAIAIAGFTAAPARAGNDTVAIIAGTAAAIIIVDAVTQVKFKRKHRGGNRYGYGHKSYKYGGKKYSSSNKGYRYKKHHSPKKFKHAKRYKYKYGY